MLKALMWLKLYRNQAIRLLDFKQAKNDFFVFFACFRPYIQPSDVHIGWATLMPFPSIYPTHPEIFSKKYWELTVLKLILSRPFWIFFSFIQWKAVKFSWVARMGRNFDNYPGFQPMRSWANTYAQDCNSTVRKIYYLPSKLDFFCYYRFAVCVR